jgi:hypothetical protein
MDPYDANYNRETLLAERTTAISLLPKCLWKFRGHLQTIVDEEYAETRKAAQKEAQRQFEENIKKHRYGENLAEVKKKAEELKAKIKEDKVKAIYLDFVLETFVPDPDYTVPLKKKEFRSLFTAYAKINHLPHSINLSSEGALKHAVDVHTRPDKDDNTKVVPLISIKGDEIWGIRVAEEGDDMSGAANGFLPHMP